jgi:endonuclease-3
MATRDSQRARRERAVRIVDALRLEYPDAHCELNYRNAFELLAATILSAQCTDVRVNMVTPQLFSRWPDPASLAAARQEDVEEVIRSTGFFRNKAKSLIGMARALTAEFGGEVPRTMAELRPIPGVGRKTANVVLGNAYGISEGITVDTHVIRITNLLGLASGSDAVKIEQQLMKLIDHSDWAVFSHLLIWHGRRVCVANRPRCGQCVIAAWCPSART